MTNKLTLESVKAAARAAYDSGTLLAQSGTTAYGYSKVYSGKEYRCAIGAACSLDQIYAIDSERLHTTVLDGPISEQAWDREALVRRDSLLRILGLDESTPGFSDMVAIQAAHDYWLSADIDGIDGDSQEMQDNFLRLIDYPNAA